MQENYIPKLADIDSARIAIDFDINLEGKDVEKILETQKILMAQKKDYFKRDMMIPGILQSHIH